VVEGLTVAELSISLAPACVAALVLNMLTEQGTSVGGLSSQ